MALSTAQKLIGVFVEQIQQLEDVLVSLLDQYDIDKAEGKQLDGLGAIVGQPRDNDTDPIYRLKIATRILINQSSGTIPQIIEIMERAVSILVGSDIVPIILTEHYPASFTVQANGYVPNGDKVKPILDEITPAGVGSQFVFDTGPSAFMFGDAANNVLADEDNPDFNSPNGFGDFGNPNVGGFWSSAV